MGGGPISQAAFLMFILWGTSTHLAHLLLQMYTTLLGFDYKL